MSSLPVPELDGEDRQSLASSHYTRRNTLKSISLKKEKSIRSQVVRRIHILSWINEYDRTKAVSDFIAGITLGLTLIPQSIAYASLANLPSQYGLYAAFMGSFVYIFFGTVKEVSVGATSLMSLLTLQYTLGKPPEYAVILAFIAGCVELLMGLFRLEFIVDFISMPVINAFTSATSIIIIVSQLKNLLGISYVSKQLIDTITELFKNYEHARWSDAILGILSVSFLLLLKVYKIYADNYSF